MNTKSSSLRLCMFIFMFVASSAQSRPTLKIGFYKHSCPSAEYIVRQTVQKFVSMNPGFAPGLVRMHFHDCFVRGCDGSILLDSTPTAPAEKDSPPNNPSIRGYEVIDEAKAKLEHICPKTVSCADILTFAARDASYIAGGISYSVPSGRRDGRVSLKSEPLQNLPPPFLNTEQLITNFAKKGLTKDEIVTLSGAHSFGISHCSSFSSRLYTFNSTHPQDPTMDPLFASYLKVKCPRDVINGGDPTVDMDGFTPNRLDSVYYNNLKYHRGLFTSDQTLFESKLTKKIVEGNAKNAKVWKQKFVSAMIKMSKIEVVVGDQGEIRTSCRFVNRGS